MNTFSSTGSFSLIKKKPSGPIPIRGRGTDTFNYMRVFSNSLYITDNSNGLISLFDLSNGHLMKRVSSYNYPTVWPMGIDTDGNGNLYVMHSAYSSSYGTFANIIVYDSSTLELKNSNYINISGLQNGGWDIAVNGNYIYAATNVSDYTGQITSYYINSGTQFGSAIVYDSSNQNITNMRIYNGDLYTDDTDNNTIYKYPIYGNGSINSSKTQMIDESNLTANRRFCMRNNFIYTYGQNNTISVWDISGTSPVKTNTITSTISVPVSIDGSQDGNSLYITSGNSLVIKQPITNT